MPRVKKEPFLITLDTETLGLDGGLKRIAIYDGMTVHYGYTFEDVEPIILKYNKMGFSPHIYIHNLEFDARKIPKFLCKENTNWNNTMQIDGKYVKIACKDYTIHDSYRLLPNSLEKLSKDFDLEHGKMDLMEAVHNAYPGKFKDKEDYFINCDPDDPVYVEYLGYDVISLYELIQKLMEISGLELGELVGRISTASLSKYIFKNGFKGIPFKDPEAAETDYKLLTSMKAWNSKKELPDSIATKKVSYLDIENKIRDGYFGGRTEVFTPWAKPFHVREVIAYHYDVNSLYPSVMIDNEYPIGYPEYSDIPEQVETVFSQWQNYREGLGYIHAAVFIPKQAIPPLPVHMGKLVFPTGHIEGTWTYNELQYAIENCGVVIEEFKEIIHFKKTAKVFHNFVEFFYKMKQEGKITENESLTSFAKLLLNTSYGWSVLNRDDKTELKNYDKIDDYPEDRIIYEDEDLGFINLKSYVDSESIQAQVGAYVTSYARIVLLDGLIRQHKKGLVYYCDTDSIVCQEKMDAEYVDKYQLGKWDLEGELYEGLFLQPKVYYEDVVPKKKDQEKKENIKFKGVSKQTQKTFTYRFYKDIFHKLCHGEGGKQLVEKDKSMLRSIFYAQKNDKDPNTLEYRDKEMDLDNKQKRNMDYANNSSEAWFMESLEMFHSFSFKKPVKRWEEYGNLIDPTQTPNRKGR